MSVETEGDAGGGAGIAADGDARLPSASHAARPLVLPETFDGTGNWTDWCFHFENVAAVNGWDEAQKLQWLRVRVTGRAQKALHRLPAPTSTSYEATRDALRARFEPDSRHTRYQAEFQSRRRRAGEGWADFADDLRTLADKAYPNLQEEARERLSINAYLTQLPQPQISFSVRQKQPSTLDEAVAATLEMESYLPVPPPQGVSPCLPTGSSEPPSLMNVDSVDQMTQLKTMVEKLTGQVEKLQLMVDQQPPRAPSRDNEPTRMPRRRFSGQCWNCHEVGHLARNCPLPRPRNQQGN